MKHIQKAGSPAPYTQWRQQMRGQLNEDYRNLPNPPRGELHQALVNEQGALCAYTMKRISIDSSHIEHIKPETLCRAEMRGSDLDYNNMVACFPKTGMKVKYRYGAQKKDDWWIDDGVQFVSPLNPQCEHLFTFNIKGEIKYNNDAAKVTIGVLGLDHKSLVEDRAYVIDQFLNGNSGMEPLSVKAAQSRLLDITHRQANGHFYEFCIAIKHALSEHIAYLTKVAKKRKYAQSQKKKKA